MVLYINILGLCLVFGMLGEDNISYIITVKYTQSYKILYPQLVEKLTYPHTFTSCMLQCNIFSLNSKDRDDFCFLLYQEIMVPWIKK